MRYLAACSLALGLAAAGCDAAPGTAPLTATRPIAAASLPGDDLMSCSAINAGLAQMSGRIAEANARTWRHASDERTGASATASADYGRANRLILLGRSKQCFA